MDYRAEELKTELSLDDLKEDEKHFKKCLAWYVAGFFFIGFIFGDKMDGWLLRTMTDRFQILLAIITLGMICIMGIIRNLDMLLTISGLIALMECMESIDKGIAEKKTEIEAVDKENKQIIEDIGDLKKQVRRDREKEELES